MLVIPVMGEAVPWLGIILTSVGVMVLEGLPKAGLGVRVEMGVMVV
jgi:hypothetical protein